MTSNWHVPITLNGPGVIAGLDPAIHRLRKRMDPRVKPAGDGPWINTIGTCTSCLGD
jgi:hypothetical protein